MSEKTFELVHQSFRKREEYYLANIVIKPLTEEFNSFCQVEANSWNPVKVTLDPEKVDYYFSRSSLKEMEPLENGLIPVEFDNDSGIDLDEIYFNAHSRCLCELLVKIEKFGVYRYREYLKVNRAVEGIIEHIQYLGSLETNSIVEASELLASIKALDFYWH